MTDSEPARCRRTDGKKWRCYKSVVKDQKYCEGHMHRGRQRSRKLVEGLEHTRKSGLLIADMNTLLLASANTCSTAKSCDREKASIPTNSQHAPPASGTGKTTPSMENVSSISWKKVNANSNHSSAFPESINSHYCQSKGNHDSRVDVYNHRSCYSTSASIKAAISSRNLHLEEDILGSYHSSKVRVISSNNYFKEGYSCNATPAYVFSQKSLPQHSPDANHKNPSHDPKNGNETEPMRCKRTDGKQWRCSHGVVPGQKYCEKHMHRGAKKVTQNSNPPIVAAAAGPSDCSDNPFFIAKRSNIHINLNMDPSPSIVACTMVVNGVNASTSSSSSDATTITD